MGHRLDLSWDSIPCDGASAPLAMPTALEPAVCDDLFRAWCQERHQSIETKLYLDEALRLLKRLLADGEISLQTRKRARRLLLAIKDGQGQQGEDQV